MPNYKELISSANIEVNLRNIPAFISERNKQVYAIRLESLYIHVALFIWTLTSGTAVQVSSYVAILASRVGLSLGTAQNIFGYVSCLFLLLLLFIRIPKELRYLLRFKEIIIYLTLLFIFATIFRAYLLEQNKLGLVYFVLIYLISSIGLAYMTFIGLAKDQLKILSKYSFVLLVDELQSLANIDQKGANGLRNIKARIRLYNDTFLWATLEKNNLALFSKEVHKKIHSIIIENDNRMRFIEIDNFFSWLGVETQIIVPIVAHKKMGKNIELASKFVLSMDADKTLRANLGYFSSALTKAWSRYATPIYAKIDIPSFLDAKSTKKILKQHLVRVKTFETTTAQQKLNLILILGMLFLANIPLQLLIGLRGEAVKILSVPFIIFFALMILFMILPISSSLQAEKQFRKAGFDVSVNGKLRRSVGILTSVLISMTLATQFLEGWSIRVYNLLSPYINAISFSVIALQGVVLLIRLRPPAELTRSSIANSLLIRELLRLYNVIVESKKNSYRRDISRHVFYAKKYFRLILKGFINGKFDSGFQKEKLQNHFVSINLFLDSLSADLKLGSQKARDNAIIQIESLIIIVLFDDFGELPEKLPEVKAYLDKKILKSNPNYFMQFIQLIDASFTVRSIVIIIIVILINILNPAFWNTIQNLSAVFQLTSP